MTALVLAVFLVIVLETGRHPAIVRPPYQLPSGRVLGRRAPLRALPARVLARCSDCDRATVDAWLARRRGIPHAHDVCACPARRLHSSD